jgi:hypothetical protein
MEKGWSMKRKSSKVRWTPEEDRLLFESIERDGTGNWSLVARALQDRSGKQCRERWVNQLNPQLTAEVWSTEEDRLLRTLVSLHGHRWSVLTAFLPGRSVNSIKNRFGFLARHLNGANTILDLHPVDAAPLPPPIPDLNPDRAMPVRKVLLPSIDSLPIGPSGRFSAKFRQFSK